MSKENIEKEVKFLKSIVEPLTTKPERIEIKRTVDDMGVLLELFVDKVDAGPMIGREGKTAEAMRTLLRLFGSREEIRLNLKVNILQS
jgi:hypothetical protein